MIDISNHQDAGFDVARAVGEGYSAVICKASEGSTYRDPCFERFAAATIGAGAIPGAYHYLRAGDGAEQAGVFHSRISSAGGPAGWLCAVDCESDGDWLATTTFVAEWARLTGGHPLLVYTGAWWWPSSWSGVALTPHLWASRYVTGTGYGSQLYASVPDSWWTPGYGGWPVATILQFSSTATVAGQKIDVNAFRGTVAELLALTTTGGETMAVNWDEVTLIQQGVQQAGYQAATAPDAIGADVDAIRRSGQYSIRAVVEMLAGMTACQTAGTVALTDADRLAIAAEVASLLAPQLRHVARIAERLGAAGDELGVLNDVTDVS
jgi:GH25 family lysozyme M1 (1,4-beta-N-acetylmuramidase)